MKYPQSESGLLEFKREIPKNKRILLKTIIAFANTYGGQVVVGVEDNKEIIGVNEKKTTQIIDNLTRSIFDSIEPCIYPSIYTKRFGDKIVIIIDISQGASKPYHFAGERTQASTFVRMGAHTMQANASIIQDLRWIRQQKFLDEMPLYGVTEKAIDLAAFKQFLSERKQKHQDTIKKMLFHYSILTKERGRARPTVGGMLLFGKNLEKHFPEAFIICSHFSGTRGRNAIAARDCLGSLFDQFNDAMHFTISRLNTNYKIKGAGKRQEKLEIPPEALREIIVNAIVHRNYHIASPIKIAVYDDRVEIISPGNFPGPIIADKVNVGVSYIRNAVISKVFRDIGIVEKLGSGFITLFESYEKYKLPEPQIIEGAGFVKCILPRALTISKNTQSKIDVDVLDLLNMQESISAKEVTQKLSVSKATATRMLAKLIAEKSIKKIGKGPATRYVIFK